MRAVWNVYESPRYSVLKFPAPVCHDCGVPMVTITTIFHHATPNVVKITSPIIAKNAEPHLVRHVSVVIANPSCFSLQTSRIRLERGKSFFAAQTSVGAYAATGHWWRRYYWYAAPRVDRTVRRREASARERDYSGSASL